MIQCLVTLIITNNTMSGTLFGTLIITNITTSGTLFVSLITKYNTIVITANNTMSGTLLITTNNTMSGTLSCILITTNSLAHFLAQITQLTTPNIINPLSF